MPQRVGKISHQRQQQAQAHGVRRHGNEKIPLGFVTTMPESRNSGYISCATPAAVE
jgi:hypothetical protein